MNKNTICLRNNANASKTVSTTLKMLRLKTSRSTEDIQQGTIDERINNLNHNAETNIKPTDFEVKSYFLNNQIVQPDTTKIINISDGGQPGYKFIGNVGYGIMNTVSTETYANYIQIYNKNSTTSQNTNTVTISLFNTNKTNAANIKATVYNLYLKNRTSSSTTFNPPLAKNQNNITGYIGKARYIALKKIENNKNDFIETSKVAVIRSMTPTPLTTENMTSKYGTDTSIKVNARVVLGNLGYSYTTTEDTKIYGTLVNQSAVFNYKNSVAGAISYGETPIFLRYRMFRNRTTNEWVEAKSFNAFTYTLVIKD